MAGLRIGSFSVASLLVLVAACGQPPDATEEPPDAGPEVALDAGLPEAPEPAPSPAPPKMRFAADIPTLPRGVRIAHALGGIDAVRGSNSLEAFLASYAQGSRVFEVDLSFTRDGDLVCLHDGWEEYAGLSSGIAETSTEEFLATRFAGAYTTLSFRGLLEVLRDHPDAWLVLDPKDAFARSMAQVLDDVEAVDPALLERVIVQIYLPAQLDVLRKQLSGRRVGEVIFTLYRTWMTPEEVVAFVERSGVRAVGIPAFRFFPGYAAALAERGAVTLVYTLNEARDVNLAFAQGVYGVYTDFQLTPAGELPAEVYPPF